MTWTVGAIVITPLWKKQKEDDESLSLVLPIGLLGLTLSFWSYTIWLTSLFTTSLLKLVELNPTLIDQILSNFVISMAIGVIVSLIIVFLIIKLNPNFKELNIFDEWSILLNKVYETKSLEYEKDEKSEDQLLRKSFYLLVGDMVLAFLLGYLAGLYYAIILYIPLYLIYIFLILILINFISFTSSLTTSMLISWLLCYSWLIKRKLYIDEKLPYKVDPNMDYLLSDRAADIIVSNEPPILCPGCRSYISALSKICKICGEKLSN